MPIHVINKDIVDRFISNNVVFIIKDSDGCNIDMVNTHENYKDKLKSHEYTPLLFKVDIFTRLSYLYGCLNFEYNKHRTEIYTFWWREIGDDNWREWFVVSPEKDE